MENFDDLLPDAVPANPIRFVNIIIRLLGGSLFWDLRRRARSDAPYLASGSFCRGTLLIERF
ncbi:hypothetical protein SBV1_1150014 [Verrucomicrobia bacterium]|nr:hypothetical protein SBV1_1150014 [Verrucomicrobiota bacterium]